jgi:hypothetical protein
MEWTKMQLAVVMQRRPLANRWQPWQWRPLEVLELDALAIPADTQPRQLLDSPEDSRWLHTGFEVELFRDEAEGYYLNLISATPSWFVMWRMDGELESGGLAIPKKVMLSYNEASRLMDGGEQVDIVPAPPQVIALLDAFVAEHYRPEPKRKRRKPSFEGGAAVQEMARAEQDPNRVG